MSPRATSGQSRSTKIIDAYLKSIGNTKKVRSTKRSTLTQQLTKVEKRIKAIKGGIGKLRLCSTRDELKKKIRAVDRAQKDIENHNKLEADFIKIAAGYAKANKITSSAWRTLGVPQGVLVKSGLIKTRKRRAKKSIRK